MGVCQLGFGHVQVYVYLTYDTMDILRSCVGLDILFVELELSGQ